MLLPQPPDDKSVYDVNPWGYGNEGADWTERIDLPTGRNQYNLLRFYVTFDGCSSSDYGNIAANFYWANAPDSAGNITAPPMEFVFNPGPNAWAECEIEVDSNWYHGGEGTIGFTDCHIFVWRQLWANAWEQIPRFPEENNGWKRFAIDRTHATLRFSFARETLIESATPTFLLAGKQRAAFRVLNQGSIESDEFKTRKPLHPHGRPE